MSWTETTLSDAPIEIIDGDRGKNYPTQNELLDDGHCLFLSATNVTKDGFAFEKCQFITEQKDNALRKGRVRRNDIVLTTRGTLGNVAHYSDAVPFDHVRINSGMVTVQTAQDELSPRYLYYYLKSDLFQAQVRALQSGAAQPQLPIRDIKKIKISYPDTTTQNRIADVVGAYDDLIENNRRRIALLEEAARLLYREWFVHFRFPGHEHVKIIDGVPEGWVEGRLSDLGLAITGKTPSKKVEANFGDDVPFIKTPDMHGNVFVISTEESLSEQGAKTQSKKTVPIGSIMVSCIGTVGAVAMNASPAQTNQQINTVIPKYRHWQFFAFFSLKAIKSRLEAMGGGATMANVNKTKFESVPILLPSDELILSFHEIVKPQFKLIEKLACKNIELAKARDLLLPRLMDGRLEV